MPVVTGEGALGAEVKKILRFLILVNSFSPPAESSDTVVFDDSSTVTSKPVPIETVCVHVYSCTCHGLVSFANLEGKKKGQTRSCGGLS